MTCHSTTVIYKTRVKSSNCKLTTFAYHRRILFTDFFSQSQPEQYTELLDTRIQIRSDFRDKLIEQLKSTFGKYYDYHRRDIATNEVDYLNVEDPDVFSHRAWELEYQRKQEVRRNQPTRTKKRSHDMEL